VVRTEPHDVILDRRAYEAGSCVFLCPLSDFLLPEADVWREELWPMIRERSDLEFYVQTKRITRLLEPGVLPRDWGDGYPNVYLNATVDDPRSSEERIAALVEVPGRHKVLALTPTTCAMNVESGLKTGQIQQAYLIGEIGCGADWDTMSKTVRPLRWEWVHDLHDQFSRWDVHFDFKACGSFWYDEAGELHTFRSMNGQFKTAQAAGLGVTGSNPEYTIAWGANHLFDITDWSQNEPCCTIHDSPQSKVFY
jgi:protein gp37